MLEKVAFDEGDCARSPTPPGLLDARDMAVDSDDLGHPASQLLRQITVPAAHVEGAPRPGWDGVEDDPVIVHVVIPTARCPVHAGTLPGMPSLRSSDLTVDQIPGAT
jgi:hypothetical protein